MKTLAIALSLLSFSAMAVETTVPAKDIIEAAKTLVSQNGPFYSVKGQIECTSINTGWGPATSTCIISIKKRTAVVENADRIINKVASTVRRTGPYYSFKGDFSATSTSQEVPPYKVTQIAKITLK